jgi:hypothetical protein
MSSNEFEQVNSEESEQSLVERCFSHNQLVRERLTALTEAQMELKNASEILDEQNYPQRLKVAVGPQQVQEVINDQRRRRCIHFAADGKVGYAAYELERAHEAFREFLKNLAYSLLPLSPLVLRQIAVQVVDTVHRLETEQGYLSVAQIPDLDQENQGHQAIKGLYADMLKGRPAFEFESPYFGQGKKSILPSLQRGMSTAQLELVATIEQVLEALKPLVNGGPSSVQNYRSCKGAVDGLTYVSRLEQALLAGDKRELELLKRSQNRHRCRWEVGYQKLTEAMRTAAALAADLHTLTEQEKSRIPANSSGQIYTGDGLTSLTSDVSRMINVLVADSVLRHFAFKITPIEMEVQADRMKLKSLDATMLAFQDILATEPARRTGRWGTGERLVTVRLGEFFFEDPKKQRWR